MGHELKVRKLLCGPRIDYSYGDMREYVQIYVESIVHRAETFIIKGQRKPSFAGPSTGWLTPKDLREEYALATKQTKNFNTLYSYPSIIK